MSERRITVQQRRAVVERAQGCCEYCRSQQRFAMQAFSVEHIVPRCCGGKTILDNLALACQGCNNHKYTKTEGCDPVTGDIVPLYHPRRQVWSDHFGWTHGNHTDKLRGCEVEIAHGLHLPCKHLVRANRAFPPVLSPSFSNEERNEFCVCIRRFSVNRGNYIKWDFTAKKRKVKKMHLRFLSCVPCGELFYWW